MKPRLKKIDALWYCAVFTPHHILPVSGRVGLGYTPDAAYLDWYRYQAKA